MIDHTSLGSGRFDEAVRFYRIVLAPCDMELLRQKENEAAFGSPDHWAFFINRVAQHEATPGAGCHVAFGAVSRERVDEAYRLALAAGAEPLFSPRERPDISPTYFGAMFRDLDGHKIEVLTNSK